MIDIGGGFPACYGHRLPPISAYGELIGRALDGLPYRPHIVAEPGRAIVAEAGVMVSTVIGTARRGDRDWVHLDVGAFNGLMEALETGNTTAYAAPFNGFDIPPVLCVTDPAHTLHIEHAPPTPCAHPPSVQVRPELDPPGTDTLCRSRVDR